MAWPSARGGRRPESVDARNRGFRALREQRPIHGLWGLYERGCDSECLAYRHERVLWPVLEVHWPVYSGGNGARQWGGKRFEAFLSSRDAF